MGRKKKRISYPKETLIFKKSFFYRVDVSELVDIINDIESEHKQYYDSIVVDFEPNYDGCYYEGDRPEGSIQFYGITNQCYETDKQYEDRCGYPPNDGLIIN